MTRSTHSNTLSERCIKYFSAETSQLRHRRSPHPLPSHANHSITSTVAAGFAFRRMHHGGGRACHVALARILRRGDEYGGRGKTRIVEAVVAPSLIRQSAFQDVERSQQCARANERNLQRVFGHVSPMPGAHGRVRRVQPHCNAGPQFSLRCCSQGGR
jgi:hypothetical protein